MRWFLLGLLVGIGLSAPSLEAVRLTKPPTLNQLKANEISQLNSWLESLWNLSNGRFTVDVVTTNPNGSREGTQGDIAFYASGGSYKFCVNTSATTPASPTGRTWRCSANAFTAP